jgi:hypothetical protein
MSEGPDPYVIPAPPGYVAVYEAGMKSMVQVPVVAIAVAPGTSGQTNR